MEEKIQQPVHGDSIFHFILLTVGIPGVNEYFKHCGSMDLYVIIFLISPPVRRAKK